MIFKSSFKYLKNEKINLIKVILKLEGFFYKNTLILFNLIVYLLNHLDSKKKCKNCSDRNKTCHM